MEMKNSRMSKVVRAGLAAALCVGMFPSVNIASAFAAESNPNDRIVESSLEDQLAGRLKTVEEVTSELETSDTVSAVDTAGRENDSISDAQSEALKASTLPTKVDLRDNGVVTNVKNQSPFGACWTFGSNGAFEISLNSALGLNTAETRVDLSAHQTAWFAYTPLSSDTSTLKGTEVSQAGEGAIGYYNNGRMNPGGNAAYQPASLWMQGIGVSKSSDIPYITKEGTRNWKIENGKEVSDDWSLTDEQRDYQVARMTKQNNIGSLQVKNSNSGFDHTDENVLKAIKSELANGHGVMISYQAETYLPGTESTWTYLNKNTWAQYNDKTTLNEGIVSNHSVTVVGYDDNYSASNFNEAHRPSKDGAFIVKNSWGGNDNATDSLDYNNEWGVDGSGYFYLSYWDHTIDQAVSYEVDTESYTGSNIDTNKEIIDQYDYLQVNQVAPMSAESGDSEGWYANMYTASENQSVHHIGTYYFNPGNELKYKIYKLKSDAKSPSDYVSSTPVAQGTYVDEYAGYVSIKLDNGVALKKGEKYVVCFSQKQSDGKYSFPRGYQYGESWKVCGWQGKTVVNEGESFKSFDSDKSWVAVTDNTTANGALVVDNYCVKAYATVTDYDVTFDTGEGTDVVAQSVAEGAKATKPATDPTREGYTFTGWFRDADCTVPWNFSVNAIEDQTTIYAGWAQAKSETTTVTVTFTNGGSTDGDIDEESLKDLFGQDKVKKETYKQKVISLGSSKATEVERTKYLVTVEQGKKISQPSVKNNNGKTLKAFMDFSTFRAWEFDSMVVTKDITLQAIWA